MKYLVIIFLLLVTIQLRAQEPIRDNSFLMEEAYNQDAGIVQHILTGQFDSRFKDADGSFTEEWPVGSILHQVSFTLPYRFYDGNNYSLNDLLLNYRYQLVAKDHIFIAPRCSFILPTGQLASSQNSGGTGFQLAVAISIELNTSFSLNANIGNSFSWYNDRKNEMLLKRSEDFSSGASLIYYITNNLNLMLEIVHTSGQNHFRYLPDENSSSTIINPGFRFAINCKSGLQIVPGVGSPIDVEGKSGAWFLYLSFEHPFKKIKS